MDHRSVRVLQPASGLVMEQSLGSCSNIDFTIIDRKFTGVRDYALFDQFQCKS